MTAEALSLGPLGIKPLKDRIQAVGGNTGPLILNMNHNVAPVSAHR